MLNDYPRGMRFDRGFFTQPVWAGLACTGVYALLNEETLPITELEGNLLAVLIGLGGLVCLLASLLKDWRLAFKIELAGLTAIIVGFVVLDFVVPLTLFQQMTMVGSLGVWIQIACIRMIAHLIRSLRSGEK